MKALMNAIRGVLRAMRRAAKAMVRTTVWIGGQLVSMFVPAPMPVYDELEPEPAEVAELPSQEGSEFSAIRNLAYHRYTHQSPTHEMLSAAGRLQAEWVSAMSKPMLKMVLTSTDSVLDAHIRGRKTIRGLLCYDEDAIDAFRIATIMERARQLEAKRRMTPARYA